MNKYNKINKYYSRRINNIYLQVTLNTKSMAYLN